MNLYVLYMNSLISMYSLITFGVLFMYSLCLPYVLLMYSLCTNYVLFLYSLFSLCTLYLLCVLVTLYFLNFCMIKSCPISPPPISSLSSFCLHWLSLIILNLTLQSKSAHYTQTLNLEVDQTFWYTFFS